MDTTPEEDAKLVAAAAPAPAPAPDPLAATYQDGADKAAPGAPQRPTLLDAYPVKVPWRVAGVHYAVGPKAPPTKNPATIAMAGVSVNATSHVVSITGSNVTLDGYDFSLDGGWQVAVIGAASARITNSNFKADANKLCPIHGTPAATDIYVGYCTIDGGVDVDTTPGTLINTFGAGLTVEFCWLKNAAGDIIDASKGGLIDIHNNLIENGGGRTGAHGDWLQLGGSPGAADVRITYNTVYQTSTAQGSQGFMIECDAPQTISNGLLSNNTILSVKTDPRSRNWPTNFLTGVTPARLTGEVIIEQNYMDRSGSAGGFLRPGSISPKVHVAHNINLRNGRTVNANNSER